MFYLFFLSLNSEFAFLFCWLIDIFLLHIKDLILYYLYIIKYDIELMIHSFYAQMTLIKISTELFINTLNEYVNN